MLWDASFDMNNVINGQHYSTIMRAIMNGRYRDWSGCYFTSYTGLPVMRFVIFALMVIISAILVLFAFRMVRKNKHMKKMKNNKKYIAVNL
jgi:hypothetical protein